MTEPLYIESAVAISAQDSFWPERFLEQPRTTGRGWYSLVDAPYQDYINPVAIRRMSRILKVSISAAMEALRQSGVQTPAAIVTGTGRGVVTDMERFVVDMERLKEATLNPTLFIQSTYNSANGWIAMQSKCQGYNQTYVHRGISFELALQDAAMLIREQPANQCVLCGSFDEMTADYFHIQGKLGSWRKPAPDALQLFDSEAEGSIAGEGSAFFVLCRTPTKARTRIRGMRILHEPDGAAIQESCQDLLRESGLEWSDVDLLVSGFNGDRRLASLYEPVHADALRQAGVALYKHLCGDFDTVQSFAVWLTNWLLINNSIHERIVFNGFRRESLNIAVVVNTYDRETASIIVIERLGPLTDK